MTAKETLINRIQSATCDEHVFNAVDAYVKAITNNQFNFLVQAKDLNFPDIPRSKVIAQFETEEHCLLFITWFGKYLKLHIKLGLIELFAIDMHKSLIVKTLTKENIDFV